MAEHQIGAFQRNGFPMPKFALNLICVLCVILAPFATHAFAQSAFEQFGWEKPEDHLPYPQHRPLNAQEREALAKVILPPKCDYSPLVTLVHCQGSGGCGGYTAAALFDIIKKRECAYAPNSSYRFQEYFYNESRAKAPPEFVLNQLDVLQRLGCVPEGRLLTNYDLDPAATPSQAHVDEAKSYRIQGYSDLISSLKVDALKRMLVLFGPLSAHGDVPGSPPLGHVFALIGYDDASRSFTILNSYGDGWGQNGMMKMLYSRIEPPAADQRGPRIHSIRYVINSPTPPTAYPYVARLNIRHNEGRNHLTVRLGAEGQEPMVVWDRPNKTRVPDRSRNLVIDVPLPDYADRFWPPSRTARWFIEVSDDSNPTARPAFAGRILEATLVDRRSAAAQTGPPVLYRAVLRTPSFRKGGQLKVEIP